MIKKIKTSIFLSLSLFGLIMGSCSQKKAPDRPHIVFLVYDDCTRMLNAYGDPNAQTPTIDKLAREGTTYENAFCVSPVYSSGHSAIISGLYPNTIGTQNMHSNFVWPRFAHMYTEYLRDAGYYCVKNFQREVFSKYQERQGWDDVNLNSKWDNIKKGQPCFQLFRYVNTYTKLLNLPIDTLVHSTKNITLPPYLPDIPETRYDFTFSYNHIEHIDAEIKDIIDQLKKQGVYESSIIFLIGDNGGVFGRSKRFMYDNALRVPLIIRFPKKYQWMASTAPGGKEDRLVSLIDLAPSLYSLLDIPIPKHMQGHPFLGKQDIEPRKFIYALRDRINESIDISRTVRTKRYAYIRNYMPQRPNGQYIKYLWETKGIPACEIAFKKGELNQAQRAFWEPKAPEEFYDILKDPHEIHNLIADTAYVKEIKRLKAYYEKCELCTHDAGFIPESMLLNLTKTESAYDIIHDPIYPFEEIMETAEKASLGKKCDFEFLKKQLKSSEPIIRYWAMMGCILHPKEAVQIKDKIQAIAETDPSIEVRINAVEALHAIGETELAVQILFEIVKENNAELIRLQAFNVVNAIGPKADPIRSYAKRTYPISTPSERMDLNLVNHWRNGTE